VRGDALRLQLVRQFAAARFPRASWPAAAAFGAGHQSRTAITWVVVQQRLVMRLRILARGRGMVLSLSSRARRTALTHPRMPNGFGRAIPIGAVFAVPCRRCLHAGCSRGVDHRPQLVCLANYLIRGLPAHVAFLRSMGQYLGRPDDRGGDARTIRAYVSPRLSRLGVL